MKPFTYRPMLLAFTQQLPPGTPKPDKSRLLGICPKGHALTAKNSHLNAAGDRICTLCLP